MSLFNPPNVRATDANNLILSGALWHFYTTGTTTPASVYTTIARNVAHANPVVADSGGKFASIYLDPTVTYRAVLKTAGGATIYDIDPYNSYIDQADAASEDGSALFGHIEDDSKITDAVATTVRDRLRPDQNRVISLMSVLSSNEKADVIAGTNAIDITTKFTTLLSDIHTNYPGATLDASMVKGTWTWTANPFESQPLCKVRLLTGDVTIKKNFNSGPITLPSYFHWEMDRTVIKPTVEVTSITTNGSPAAGLFQTHVQGLSGCSGTSGQSTITLGFSSDAARLAPGARIAAKGLTASTCIKHELAADMTIDTTSFTVNTDVIPGQTIGDPAATWGGSGSIVVMIDSELILCSASANGLTLSSATRGYLGSNASTHTAGATVTLMESAVYEILSISGTTVTIDGTLPRTFTGATCYSGSYDSRLTGRGTIEGDYNFVANGSYVWSGIASSLSGGFTVAGSINVIECPHGAVFLMATKNADVRLRRAYQCSRPVANIGAAVWDFGGGLGNRVEIDFAEDGYFALFVDDKSSGVPQYGTIGIATQNNYHFGNLTNYEGTTEICAATDNNVVFGRITSTTIMPSFENAVSSSQTTVAVNATGNTAHILNYQGNPSASGSNVSTNTVIVNGRVVPTPYAATATPLSVTAIYSGRTILLDLATGVTATLPAATGTGNRYRFVVKTSASGGSYIIKVSNSSHVMDGIVYAADDTATPVPLVWVTAADSDTITLNGTTTGGIIGDEIELEDIASNQWKVRGFIKQSGSEATPFSATV